MMRITQTRGRSVLRLRLEGRLTGATLAELNRVLDDAGSASAVLLDLTGLTYTDAAGVRRLNRLRRQGAVMIGCSAFVEAMLDRGEVDDRPPARR